MGPDGVSGPVSLGVAEAAALLAARRVSPVELTEACLARITALDPALLSFVEVTADRARRDAARAEAEIAASGPRSPLHGIPFALKDIFDVAGLRTTAGSRLLAGHVATADGGVVERLQAAGAVLLGKNATWEFAHGGPSWDALHPPARNPWDTDLSPAGSSSGSAAAVAAGLAPFRTRVRHRRVHPQPRGGLRDRRPQADLWPCQPARGGTELFQPRPCRTARPDGA